jgi:hypothetical protein
MYAHRVRFPILHSVLPSLSKVDTMNSKDIQFWLFVLILLQCMKC